jgi:hypothetical protein
MKKTPPKGEASSKLKLYVSHGLFGDIIHISFETIAQIVLTANRTRLIHQSVQIGDFGCSGLQISLKRKARLIPVFKVGNYLE